MRHRTRRATPRALSFILILAIGFLALRWHAAAVADAPKHGKPMPPADANQAIASDAFARALFAQLAGREGNLAVSPTSIESCVFLALAGAGGMTAEEIAQALKLSDRDAADVGRLLDRARAGAQSPTGKMSGSQLTIANSAWFQRGFPIHDAYRKLLEANGRATFETVDFATQTEVARAAINAWVDRETKHKIPELFDSGSLDGSTRMVLANAIYFKGLWRHPFKKEATTNEPFHRPGAADVTVPLMHLNHKFRYLEAGAYQIVELPYEKSPYAMIVWLPKKLDALAGLEQTLTGQGINVSLAKLANTQVDLFLPRFKVGSNLGLADVLSALGMKAAFTPAADFSGISDEPLAISKVVHQALVEVDEEGTEAAAATGIVGVTAAAIEPVRPKVFRADHPFLFAIRHAASGEVLFFGRVETPEK